FPFAMRDQGKTLCVAMEDPSDIDAADDIGRRAGVRVAPFVAITSQIQEAIAKAYPGSRFSKISREKHFDRSAPIDMPKSKSTGAPGTFKVTTVGGKTLMSSSLEDMKAAEAAAGEPPATQMRDETEFEAE